MASNHHSPPNPPTPPQSIPLQDLSRPPDAHDITDERRSRRRSSSSGGGRSIGNRTSLRNALGPRYERIAESPPSPERRGIHLPRPSIATVGHSSSRFVESFEPHTPVEDLHGFAAATSSVGLNFDNLESSWAGDQAAPVQDAQPRPSYSSESSFSFTRPGRSQPTDSDAYFSPTDTDTTPLTDPQYLQPISGAGPSTPQGPRQGMKSKRQSVHWLDGAASDPRPGSRLGDDLPRLETGLNRNRSSSGILRRASNEGSNRSRSRSPSTSPSALTRAGSMMRMMSQRVVNLSNDAEVVEQSIRRKSSVRHARLEGPPSLPVMMDFAAEEAGDPPPRVPSPVEKVPSKVEIGPSPTWRRPSVNLLMGHTMGIFSSDNKIRQWLCEVLVHPLTEPFILLLIVVQTVLLAVDSAPSVYSDPRSKRWGSSKIDYALLGLFIIYSLEVIARIIVSGFVLNPGEHSTLDRSLGLKGALIHKSRSLLAPQRSVSVKNAPVDFQPSLLRSFTGLQPDEPASSRQQARFRLARRAYLRHSFNRLDFLAVVSFWISFGLSLAKFEANRHVYVFQMMSCLRILRLLNLTTGTSVILRSLKKAAPMLLNVAFLISFFWLIFAIVGVQSFKSSLRRSCVWVGPPELGNYTQNLAPENYQPCGGHLDARTGLPMPWMDSHGKNGTDTHKGYLCPQGSLCILGDNPYSGTVSFDNVINSLQIVFVIISSNTFTDIMYYTTDSDYLAAALFFAAGIVIMSFWLMNLLVAVITSSFQVIREESKRSAFATEEIEELPMDDEKPHQVKGLKRTYDKTYWIWIAIIILSLIVQCLRSSTMGDDRRQFIDNTETIVTVILLFEIIFRFATDWKNFFRSKRNLVDLGIAILTAVIQIPPIHNSGQAYAWLTIFQIARIYRVVLAFTITRDLIMIVFGNILGLLNLIVFVFLITFLTAIFAAQLFRGELPQTDPAGNTIRITFFGMWNSFIGMYQVLSSENWTTMMYNATQFDVRWDTAWIGAMFFIMWFILANFIVLNMFIAVNQESFDVSEDEKRLQQVKAFLQQRELGGSSQGNLSLSTIFRLGRDSGRHRDPLDYGPATMEMLLKDAVVKEFLDEVDQQPLGRQNTQNHMTEEAPAAIVQPGMLLRVWSKITGINSLREPNPFYSTLKFSRAQEDLDARTLAKEVLSATEQRRRAQRQYLVNHPRYNVSLFLFTPYNPIRRLCQRIVGPGRGSQRIEGVEPFKPVWYTFSAFIYAAIVAMVLLACVTTPLYQKVYFESHDFSVDNWFVWSDMGFAVLFTIEASIKVIADGFFWTPNAYFRGSWGFIDGLVLVTLWINVTTSLYKDGAISRAVGAFKALRALRLLNVSDSARDTFHSIIVLGGWKVISAAFVSISLLIPFAVYGLNLFNGQLLSCNDSNFGYGQLSNCVGEWKSTPYNWTVLAPRQVSNPYYSFDNFGSSLFILFQIVSQEGWTDVMWSAMEITGRGLNPQSYASQGNAVFFIIFNLLGAVFVLTLFVSVFMRNYTEQTGVAFLTADQRSWLEMRKLLRQISPSKRPVNTASNKWTIWCHRIAVKKHGRWQKFITSVLMVHLVLLMVEFYPEVVWWDKLRDYIFLVFTLCYTVNITIRILGLSWRRFRRSSWDLFSVVSVVGTIITTVMALSRYGNHVFSQLHKLFLVSIVFLLIPRNNQLDQLFKTAAGSLTAIGNLLATWFVLFLVYAIAFTQTFGLTKFGGNESGNLNFRDVPKALILLFRMSCGEGWNAIMEDFATITPPYCVADDNFFLSDCGSGAWARALFISWNILSMYIFVSLFVSLIFESFSYVYQRSSSLSAVSREEIRRFKQAWATFDPNGTGYITKEAFPRLLGELSGVFEMRIYDGEHSVRSILEGCQVNRRDSEMTTRVIDGVDLDKLNARLRQIPIEQIRKRRARMNIFYEEILVSADPDRGISFTSCLMILAHYNVISDSKSLRLEEFLRRRARLARVEEAVRRNIVVGFFDTLYWTREFRRQVNARKSSRMVAVPDFSVPEIYVDNPDDGSTGSGHTDQLDEYASQPMLSPRSPDHRRQGSSSSNASGYDARGVPPIDTSLRHRGDSRSNSPTHSDYSNTSPSALAAPRTSHVDTAYHGPDASPRHGRSGSSVSAQGAMMESFDNSAWGESIRRSFTMRRPNQRSMNGR